MSPSKEPSKDQVNSSRLVKFAQTEADQVLLEAVEAALAERQYGSFSDLCRQALRQFLLSQPQRVIPEATELQQTDLQQQVLTLQQQVAHLEKSLAGVQQVLAFHRLEQQISQLNQQMTQQMDQLRDRLVNLEFKVKEQSAEVELPLQVEPIEPLPPDPLLSRLVPLLEDF